MWGLISAIATVLLYMQTRQNASLDYIRQHLRDFQDYRVEIVQEVKADIAANKAKIENLERRMDVIEGRK